ncbi:MAG: GNAT family N-acetyltransferase [Paludibacter sp.]
MILLNKNEYQKATAAFNEVTFNNLFARFVLEQHIHGKVFVDNREHPETFYISHPYGMSLLFGKTDNDTFNAKFLDYAFNIFNVRTNYEWLQVFPSAWNETCIGLFGDKLVNSEDSTDDPTKIEVHTRVNFKFNKEKYLDFKSEFKRDNCKIIRTDAVIFENMPGSVVPRFFWKDAEQFGDSGVGFSLLAEGKVASTAYSAFILDDKLEIGIETAAETRGKGFAMAVCSALIDYCIENNYEPVWACRLENRASYYLAQKIGFEPTVYLPFYRLLK